jgi:hypothetical protein
MQPEKAVIFGPIILFFVFFGALVVGFLVVVIKLVAKGRASAWRGELVDKIYKSRRNFDDANRVDEFYTLVFKTEDGKTLKVGTSRQVYDSYTIGDKAEKKAGEFWPKKLS